VIRATLETIAALFGRGNPDSPFKPELEPVPPDVQDAFAYRAAQGHLRRRRPALVEAVGPDQVEPRLADE
jgi:hypothetical protein